MAEQAVAARKADGRDHRFDFSATSISGLYEFHLTRNAGDEVVQYGAVTLDPTESDLASSGGSTLLSEGSSRVEYVRDEEALLTSLAGERQELWWPLLLLAAAVLMTEQTLAWWFGKRG